MGKYGRNKAKTIYNPNTHYEELMKIYKKVIEKIKSR